MGSLSSLAPLNVSSSFHPSPLACSLDILFVGYLHVVDFVFLNSTSINKQKDVISSKSKCPGGPPLS